MRVSHLLPGFIVCILVSAVAWASAEVETWAFGRAWLETLVLAILLGTAIRTAWTPGARFKTGIAFTARTVLEIAVVLLGASLSLGAILAAGPALILAVAAVVVIAIGSSYGIGRALGLRPRLAALVACGNSICGNSAIAAVAPVIAADGQDVAASIAFTAVLGVVVVLLLPVAGALLGLSELQYGALAGLTVYAVPQVLAATVPVGAVAAQFGTLVKLVRVLMLGPVVMIASFLARRAATGPETPSGKRPGLAKLVPWFIVGFLALAVLRSAGALPDAVLGPAARAATILTILSMAALGLQTDLRAVARAGGRTALAVTLSLLMLGGLSLGVIRLLNVA